MSTKERRYLITEQDDDAYQLVSVVVQGGIEIKRATYTIKDGTCTCPGFTHRKHCKHVTMIAKLEDSDVITVAHARDVFGTLSSHFADFVTPGSFVLDELVKDGDGAVLKIKISAHLTPAKSMLPIGDERLMVGRVQGVWVEITLR